MSEANLSRLNKKGFDKSQAIEELQKRGIDVDESETFEVLRKKLQSMLKKKIAEKEKKTNSGLSGTDEKRLNKEAKSTKSNSSERDSESESDKDSTMSDENVKLQYCLEKDDWKIFAKRLGFYFASKKIENDTQKVATLLTRVDEETFKLFKQLAAPDELETKKYANLIKLMTDHLHPKPSQAMERCVFNQAKQECDESITEFAARLKKLSLDCGFHYLKEKLCDHLVCGIRDKETRIKLFEQEKLDYESALKIATAREAAVKNASGSQSVLEYKSTKSDVYALHDDNRGRFQKKDGNQNSKRKGTREFDRQATAASSQQQQFHNNRGLVCFCCGKVNHTSRECRFRDYTCNHCNKRGHLVRACRLKQAETRKSSVNLLQGEQANIEEEDTTELMHNMDFYRLELNDKNVHNIREKQNDLLSIGT